MPTPNLNYVSASVTHKGMLRDLNEDSLLVNPALGLYAVADGMGGHQAGDVASRLCLEALQQHLRSAGPGKDAGAEALGKLAVEALAQANTGIRQSIWFNRVGANMGTTVALLLIRGDQALLAHVGDSRIYRLRGGSLQLLTRDHSFLQAQVGAGFVTREEALKSHNRNLVTRALGMSDQVNADIAQARVLPGDVFLLCSDGLNTMVSDDDLALVLAELGENPDLACRVLVQVANDNGGHDNITVVLVKAEDPLLGPRPPGWWRRLLGWFQRGRH